MSHFVVSARKYRPQRFDEVVGQEHISKTLKNALQNDQLAHAFLFCGPRGVGKTTCARILAKVLNCENRTSDFEACNECASCKAFNRNASFNISELDAASNNSVEHIRALIEQVRFQPQQGLYKIFIIDEVHMLSQQAFNAFLKTLEEPPSYAIFILATTEKHKIIPTILSRCQIFDFKRIQIPRTVAHLQHICREEGIKADKEALHIIAQKADGALRDALSIFDRMSSFSEGMITYDSVIENLNVLDYDYYFKVVDAMVTEDTSSVLLIFDEIFKKGFEPDIFAAGLAEHLRNLLVCKDAKTLSLLEISEELKDRYQQQANIVPSSFILTALNIAADCDVNYKMARHKRLLVEIAILKMTYIGRAIELSNDPVLPSLTPDNAKEKTMVQEYLKKKSKNVIAATGTKVEEHIENNAVPPISAIEKATASNIKVEEPAPPPISQTPKSGSLKRAKNSKFDMPSLTNLIDLEKEKTELTESAILELDKLVVAWEQYLQKMESPSTQQSFKTAIIRVKDTLTVEVEVGSQMSKELIQQERDLIPFLRNTLSIPNIALEITIDPKKAKETLVFKKILSIKEKYELMREKNPLVQDLSLRLGLKPDND